MDNFTVSFGAGPKGRTTEDVDMNIAQTPAVKDLIESIGELKMKRSSSGSNTPVRGRKPRV